MLRWQELKSDGYWARRAGDLEEAERLYLAAIDELARDEKWLPERLTTMNALADLYNEKGEPERAIQIARSILKERRIIASRDDIRLGGDLMFLAINLARQGEYSEAVDFAEEGVEIYRSQFGDEHSETRRMRAFLMKTREPQQTRQNGRNEDLPSRDLAHASRSESDDSGRSSE
jgi:tetratricopeptide (TPR) repeat protein